MASSSWKSSAEPNQERKVSATASAPFHSAGPGGSNARNRTSGSRVAGMRAKSRVVSASKNSPPTDHRAFVAGVVSTFAMGTSSVPRLDANLPTSRDGTHGSAPCRRAFTRQIARRFRRAPRSTSYAAGVTSNDPTGLRLAELVAAFSLASDLGLGQPMEHVLRSWVIAARLSDHMGLDESDRAALYYVTLLAWVGCVAETPELARWFGDDIAFRADGREVDLAGLPMLGFMLRHVGAGAPALQRIRLGATLVVTGGRGVEETLLSHCISTGQMATRLGLGPEVSRPLQQVFTRWDGKGVPRGVGGEEIAEP